MEIFRSQIDLIRVNRPELKCFQDFPTVCSQCGCIRCPSRKAFPWCGIDMVYDQVHIPLGGEFKAGAFGQYHA